ncbi:MAG: DUF721 domain-containing protein [Nitriliruptorales bacterium]|nr:DUF721 domain-containing protein [Nitriliruptorales bacterium]
MTSGPGRSRGDEERRLANLRRKQERDRARIDRDDALLPTTGDDDDWDVPDGSVRRRVPAPLAIGDVVGDVVSTRGWADRLHTSDVLRRWPSIVGEAVAAHARPVRLAGGILVVAASDSAWVTQVRYLATEIRDRVNEHLPERQAVRSIDVVLDRGGRDA